MRSTSVSPVVSPVAGNSFEIQFDTVSGRTYQVKYTTDFSAWQDLPGGQRAGTGQRETVSDPVGDAVRRFYRVEVSLP